MKTVVVYILILLLTITSINAVGLGMTSGISNDKMVVGQQKTLSIFVSEGNVSKMVTIFMKTNGTGLKVQGVQSFTMSKLVTGTQIMQLNLSATAPGDYLVQWGVEEDSNSTGGISFDGILQKQFVMKVSGAPVINTTTNVTNTANTTTTVPSTPSSSGGGSGGGGGGGYVPSKVNTSKNSTVVKPVVPVIPPIQKPIETPVVVKPVEPPAKTVVQEATAAVVAVVNKAGKGIAITVLCLGAIALILQLGLMSKLKGAKV